MPGDALTSRGVRHDDVHAVTIQARAGYVSICTRRLPEPLDRAEWLHAVKLLVGRGLAVWPELSDTLATVVETARGHAAAETEARS